MDSAERCRAQLAECRRLMPLAKSAAEATVLKNLVRSWKMIVNQTALYEEIIQPKSKAASVGGLSCPALVSSQGRARPSGAVNLADAMSFVQRAAA
jgi:hypothetical protein